MRIDLRLLQRAMPAWTLCCGLVACASDNVPTTAATQDSPNVTRDYHPSGPTTRREWRHTAGQQPYRIELQGARSGRLVVGQARLWRRPDGRWVIETATGESTTVHDGATSRPASPRTFTEGGITWTVSATRETLPVARAGIPTESEPSLDLVLECIR